ncbi:flavodoxin [Faecalispora anaeroviscerum]|uniref:flavodoxin n=1 Tax=Faecalispora anaeroviscerum TaxID=2991836 RepID=UPI0024B8EAE7|nr:flavodoxin [Faecalispora anaeroviscerum]
MAKLAVVYWSGTGNTEAMANLVADGAREAGADVSLYTSAEFTPELADEFEHIAFGCPSMGAEQLEESEFEPMLDSVKEKLSSKKVALFGSYGWGDGEWMRTWDSDLQGDGVPVVGTVITNEAPDEEAAENCKNLGKALANA